MLDQDLERWGTIRAWSKAFDIPVKLLAERLQDVPATAGRTRDGGVADFYAEGAVRRACADLVRDR